MASKHLFDLLVFILLTMGLMACIPQHVVQKQHCLDPMTHPTFEERQKCINRTPSSVPGQPHQGLSNEQLSRMRDYPK